MRKLSLITCAIFVINSLLYSCKSVINPKERNKFVFKNNLEDIRDSIKTMNKILVNFGQTYFTYAITDSFELYVTNKKGDMCKTGVTTDKKIYNDSLLSSLEFSERLRFIKIVLFLKKNYLTRCDMNKRFVNYDYRNDIFYKYARELYLSSTTDLDRSVVLLESNEEQYLNNYKVLDKYKNLYLLAGINAKIYVGKR